MAKNFNKPKHEQKSEIKKAKESIKIDHDDFVSFSFKYFDDRNQKFHLNDKDLDYFIILLNRFKDISTFKIQEFYSNRNKALRCHPIDWNDTTEECFDLRNEDQLVDTPYQFGLSANEYGRVHGFLINSIFFIRWFDPDHKLYE